MNLQDGGQRAVVGVGKLVGQRAREHVPGDGASAGHRRRAHHRRHARHEAVKVERLGVRRRVLARRDEDETRGDACQLRDGPDARRDLTATLRRDAGETDVVYLLDPRLTRAHTHHPALTVSRFTARRNARIASAVLRIAIPSVRPSHAGIVSKRRHAPLASHRLTFYLYRPSYSIAQRGACFQRRLFVCQCVCVCTCV